MIWLLALLIFVVVTLGTLLLWRVSNAIADEKSRRNLIALAASVEATYHPDLVAALPEPAQRFFNFTIEKAPDLSPAPPSLIMMFKGSTEASVDPIFLDFVQRSVTSNKSSRCPVGIEPEISAFQRRCPPA